MEDTRVTLNIEISNLKPHQAEKISEYLRCWEWLGNIGSSRMTKFYIDGDGDERYKVLVNGEQPPIPENSEKYIDW